MNNKSIGQIRAFPALLAIVLLTGISNSSRAADAQKGAGNDPDAAQAVALTDATNSAVEKVVAAGKVAIAKFDQTPDGKKLRNALDDAQRHPFNGDLANAHRALASARLAVIRADPNVQAAARQFNVALAAYKKQWQRIEPAIQHQVQDKEMASQVAFALDLRGGLMARYDDLRQILEDRINALPPHVAFAVIYNADGESGSAMGAQWMPGNDESKKKTKELLAGLSCRGQTHWKEVMDAAIGKLSPPPQLISLFMDPSYRADDAADDFEKITQDCVHRGIHVRTTLALAGRGATPEDCHLLWQLSHDTGGVCVDADGNPAFDPLAVYWASPEH